MNQLLSSLVGFGATCCASSRDEVVKHPSVVGLRSVELSVLNRNGSSVDHCDPAVLPFSTESPRPGEFVGKLIHVDLRGNFQFKSIQDAIDNAENGDRIFIHSGVYNEQIQLTKQIELVGVGSVESVVIELSGLGFDIRSISESEDALLTMEAAHGRIRNISFARKDGSGVVIENKCGDLIVEGCAINGGGTGIRVSDSASVVARYCDISGCTAHGVMSCSSSWISLEKCLVSDCFHGAFSSDLGTQCSIKDCDIVCSSQVGLVLHDEAQVKKVIISKESSFYLRGPKAH